MSGGETMITIYCALYPEAQELIHFYQLKKETGRLHFQVFSNEETGIRLVITGAGAVSAAVAVAEVSTVYPPRETDFLVNFGSCGARGFLPKEIFLCNKITDVSNKRTFYPDVLYPHPFHEAEITCVPRPQKNGEMKEESLCDMEAAAVYQAGNYYYGPHQMIFLKVVSDSGCPDSINKQDFSQIMKMAAGHVTGYLDGLLEITHRMESVQRSFLPYAKQLGEALSCSVTMQAELEQLLNYLELAGKDYQAVIKEYYQSKKLPCDRREGKRILEELKSGLL